MPSPATQDNDEPPEPVTPQKGLAPRKTNNDKATTPPRKTPSPNATPKSAPAAAAAARMRANSKKAEPPTLLADFLMGRPSPARKAADRQRRKSVDAVRVEIRQEMRQGAVRKLQQPGGVKDRVKQWQKTNTAVLAEGVPDDAATEPTDVAFKGEEAESVTEEDRIRIKMRQKKRTLKPKPAIHKEPSTSPDAEGSQESGANPASPPKKRVVSDGNWRRRGVGSNRKVSPRSKKSSSTPRTQKDFVLKPTPNPSASSKVKDWVARVEAIDETSSWSSRSSRSNDKSNLVGGRERSATVRDPPARRKKETGDDDPGSVTASSDGTTKDRRRATMPSRSNRFGGDIVAVDEKKQTQNKGSAVKGAIALLEAPPGRPKARGESKDNPVEQSDIDGRSQSQPDTPTRRPRAKSSHTRTISKSKDPRLGTAKTGDDSTWISDTESNLASTQLLASDLASNMTTKSLADIPGDIPVGYSAFSELDLPLRGKAETKPRRPKVDRNSSLKGMPKVFKKVVEEGKKMIQDMNEPPKQPVSNKPPSIEKWLNNTVDPFVESSADDPAADKKPASALAGYDEEAKSKRHASHETKRSRTSDSKLEPTEVDSKTEETTDLTDVTPKAETGRETATSTSATTPPKTSTPKTPTPNGLKRRSATRISSSPIKSGGKRPFLGMLKEAFQGESGGYLNHPKTYQSQEHRPVDDDSGISDDQGLSDGFSDSPSDATPIPAGDDVRQPMEDTPLKMLAPRFRPPTKGHHELSTIMSEEDSSVIDSDGGSNLTFSTATQSTALTRDSETLRTDPPGSGLKRRLTKHSDLVSVLSLPDDSNIPNGMRSNRSRPSQRRNRGSAAEVTAEELLQEFVEDEAIYLRELKTLVDGVVPVLLSQVVNSSNASDLFGSGTGTENNSVLSKSVVNMGVSLEKLKNAHKKAPLTDLRRLANWAHGVVPIYHSYLGAWRLGYQDLVVNLAPIVDALRDDDSLLDAMPRNKDGDLVNSEGERVDVAHLLKRPLLRIKQITKFVKCVDEILPTEDTRVLLRDFEQLQEKARIRHREETARLTDEDAINTDTTRCRDIRTFDAMESVTIDPNHQVSAKDVFSLDLAHSNGQRLECSVELVHRDSRSNPDDKGDVLIRETGGGRRSYLLFQPLAVSTLSARTGDGNHDMVVMIRHTHKGKQGHELLTLSSDSEDQILDWLDILPVSPVPPREPEPSVVGDDEDESPAQARLRDVPVGAHNLARASGSRASPEPPYPRRAATYARRPVPPPHRTRTLAAPGSARMASTEDQGNQFLEKTPTEDSARREPREPRSRPLSESMRPDPLNFQKRQSRSTHRDDGAPPPPVHRTLSRNPPVATDPPQLLATPEKTKKQSSSRRRTSSPLKHEYLPSDISSTSEISATDESDIESSDDEIESVDIPETEIGVSIKKEDPFAAEPLFSGSECSLTPSNSASQAGLHGPKTAHVEPAARYLATVSRWSDRGTWKDLMGSPCSILVSPGLIEAFAFRTGSGAGNRKSTGADDGPNGDRPLIALDLTPLVLIRQSTTVDLEIRSSVQPHSQLAGTYGGGNFRFRCHTGPDCFSLYMSVHHARLNNQKFIQLESEARFKSFGERRPSADNDGDTSSRRRSWFGRKNSYRGSVRAPSQSFDGGSTTPSSSPSASTFLKRLTVAGNLSFNLARSSIDKHSRAGSGGNSLYTSGSSSTGGTPPRSPSISVGNSGRASVSMGSENIRIRLHLLVSAAKWEDYGNCSLQVRRPPPGWHQALRADHGLEKRVTVTTLPKKEGEQPRMMLDAVLGSGCFSPMGTRGIVCGIWEEVKDADGVVGMVPATGATGGNIKKWCFQCASVTEANWVLRLVHQEVFGA